MAASGTASLDFGAFPGATDAAVLVTGQAGIVAGSLVGAWIRPVATAAVTYRSRVIADGAVAYWRLGEPSGTNANDEVGTNDGTYVNTPTLGVAGALSGSGDADTAITVARASAEYVNVPDHASLDQGNGPLTWELLCKRVDLSASTGPLMSKGSLAPAFGFENSYIELVRAGWATVARSSIQVTNTLWHHVVCTKTSGNVWKIYIDGVDVTVGVTADVPTTDTAFDLHIGEGLGGSYFDGSIDEVAIYNVALTPSQVANHYLMAQAAQAEHSADEHRVEDLFVVADTIVAGTGFTIYGRAGNNRLYGAWTCAWAWS